jgi:hypothetical protein
MTGILPTKYGGYQINEVAKRNLRYIQLAKIGKPYRVIFSK